MRVATSLGLGAIALTIVMADTPLASAQSTTDLPSTTIAVRKPPSGAITVVPLDPGGTFVLRDVEPGSYVLTVDSKALAGLFPATGTEPGEPRSLALRVRGMNGTSNLPETRRGPLSYTAIYDPRKPVVTLKFELPATCTRDRDRGCTGKASYAGTLMASPTLKPAGVGEPVAQPIGGTPIGGTDVGLDLPTGRMGAADRIDARGTSTLKRGTGQPVYGIGGTGGGRLMGAGPTPASRPTPDPGKTKLTGGAAAPVGVPVAQAIGGTPISGIPVGLDDIPPKRFPVASGQSGQEGSVVLSWTGGTGGGATVFVDRSKLKGPAVVRIEGGRQVQVSAPILPGKGRGYAANTKGEPLVVVLTGKGPQSVKVTLTDASVNIRFDRGD